MNITVNGSHISIIKDKDGCIGTVSTDTQTVIFVDRMKTEKEVEMYIANCKMLFSMLGKEHDNSSFS